MKECIKKYRVRGTVRGGVVAFARQLVAKNYIIKKFHFDDNKNTGQKLSHKNVNV